ncbi:MAG: methionyl-tRNA formyltransferase [Alphaproteobacteria bacterium]|nr:methionyl-tRNA formyltransferase [Alphaproteobacteria bacterium]
MKIAVFTSNQPRHLALLTDLAAIADEVFAVQECTTVFPGQVPDFFGKSAVMRDHFARVIAAEQAVFGSPRFLPGNVRHLALRMGDLALLDAEQLAPAIDADAVVVLGASYICGALVERLIKRRALNIHMGISPYYRGSSCNFWALYDRRPELVGATIHLLGRGLDSGRILFHARPTAESCDPFLFGMRAVHTAHRGLLHHLGDRSWLTLEPVVQDRSRQIRYTRHGDYTDVVADEYLGRLRSPAMLAAELAAAPPVPLVRVVEG